jgi:hypothetical protein
MIQQIQPLVKWMGQESEILWKEDKREGEILEGVTDHRRALLYKTLFFAHDYGENEISNLGLSVGFVWP